MSLKVLLMAMSMAAGSTFGIVAQSAAVVDVLKEVKAEYAPDTRVAVWSVMAKTVDGVEVLTGDVDNQSAKSDILARLDKLNIKFEDKIKILPEATVKGPWALVSISVACVRGAAASGAELTSQAIMGTPVRVLKSEDGMSMVQTPDEYIGYVTDNSLKFISEEEFYSWKKADRLVVTELETSMYEKPKVDNQTIVSDLLLGNILVKKGEKGKDKWNYPDIVGIHFPFDDYKEETLGLLKNLNKQSCKIYSFEIKKSITWADIKEYYFQAVSNSSWTNEGYLVVFENIESDIFSELIRLNASFGIGIIQLEIDSSSKVILPARQRNLDMQTLDMLVEKNKNFKDFIDDVNKDINANDKFRIAKDRYDKILNDDGLEKYIKEKHISKEE